MKQATKAKPSATRRKATKRPVKHGWQKTLAKRRKALKRDYRKLTRKLKKVYTRRFVKPVRKGSKGWLKPRRLAFIGILLVLIGIAGAAPTVYFQVTNHGSVNATPFSAHVASSPVPVPKKQPITGNPVSMSVPSTWINNLPVVPGYYDEKSQEWTLTLDKAHFATITTAPNDTAGQTFIYGHYRPEVFAYLHNIAAGAEATVDTDNGYRFTYVLKTTFAVPPTDTSVFSYQGAPILTIQTCSGAWFQNRQMYQFDFQKVEKL